MWLVCSSSIHVNPKEWLGETQVLVAQTVPFWGRDLTAPSLYHQKLKLLLDATIWHLFECSSVGAFHLQHDVTAKV